MNKAETRELDKVKTLLQMGMTDTAARALSALIRSTLKRTTAAELRSFAVAHGLATNPEFII
jgi:hypothetical protein